METTSQNYQKNDSALLPLFKTCNFYIICSQNGLNGVKSHQKVLALKNFQCVCRSFPKGQINSSRGFKVSPQQWVHFLLQGCQILLTNFKCKEKFSKLSNFKPSFRGWFQVITHWKASGSHYFLPLFPHLPWSIWIHPYSSLASFLERWLGLGQSYSEWEKGWDGPSAQANPDTRARLINTTHTDKQEAQFSGKLNIQ